MNLLKTVSIFLLFVVACLGKTVEACLVLSRLVRTGHVERTLVPGAGAGDPK